MKRRRTINTVSFFAFQDIITSVVGIFVLITLIMMLELAQTVSAKAAKHPTVAEVSIQNLEQLQQELDSLTALQQLMQTGALQAAVQNKYTIEEDLKAVERRRNELEDELQMAQRRTVKLQREVKSAKQRQNELTEKQQSAQANLESARSNIQIEQEKIKARTILEIEKPLIFRDKTEQGRYLVLVVIEQTTLEVSDAQTGINTKHMGVAYSSRFGKWLDSIDISTRQFLLIVKPSGEKNFGAIRKQLDAARAVYGFDVAGQGQNFRLRSQVEDQ